jgi:A/G-specific adenine glycosylase
MKRSRVNAEFRRNLLQWFDVHARDLPWRRTADPYAIWVSEIMLQQTRVAAVIEHYARFMAIFPSVEVLARASEAEVLACWSGLGYYRRARMLHKAAQAVVTEYAGMLPETAFGLRALAGIGDYTSAAIASIAFGEPVAAVDGNVERVIARYLGLDATGAAFKKSVRNAADVLLSPERAGDFNQAMMELGATVCLPRNPLCLQCPVQAGCATRGEHPMPARKKMLNREVAYAFLERKRAGKKQVLLEQRSAEASLMAGMWELPQVEISGFGMERSLLSVRHSITTTNYSVTIFSLLPKEQDALPAFGATRLWISLTELGQIPLTGLARKVLKRLKVLPGDRPLKDSLGEHATEVLLV